MSDRTAQLILNRNKNANPLYKITGPSHNPSVQGEMVDSERKEMLNWANGHLQEMPDAKLLVSLERDLGDGVTLLHLAEELACEVPTCYHDNPVMRFQKIENIDGCLKFLSERGVNLVNVSAADLVDSNLKAVLALCHAMRLRFDGNYAKRHQKNPRLPWKQENSNRPSHQPSNRTPEPPVLITLTQAQKQKHPGTADRTSKNVPKSNKSFEGGYHGYYSSLFGNRNIGGIVILYKEDMAVLSWVQKLVKITIPDYTVFEDGIILCAIVNHLCNGVITHEEILFHTPEERLEIAIETAQHYLGVPPQLSVDAVVRGKGQNELLSYLQMLKSLSQYIKQGNELDNDAENQEKARERENALRDKLEKHREEVISEKVLINEFFKSLEMELEEYHIKQRQQDSEFVSKLKEEERLSRQRYEESMLQLEREKEEMEMKKQERKQSWKPRRETGIQCSLDNEVTPLEESNKKQSNGNDEYDIDTLRRWKKKRRQKSLEGIANKHIITALDQAGYNKDKADVGNASMHGQTRITPFYRHFGPDRYSDFLAMTDEGGQVSREERLIERTEPETEEKISDKDKEVAMEDRAAEKVNSLEAPKHMDGQMNNTILLSERKEQKLPSIHNNFSSGKQTSESSFQQRGQVEILTLPTLVDETVKKSLVDGDILSTSLRRSHMMRQDSIDDRSEVELGRELTAKSAPSSPQSLRRRFSHYSSPVSMYSTDKFFSAYSMPFISVMDAEQMQRRKSFGERDLGLKSLPLDLQSRHPSEMLRISHNKSKSLPAKLSSRFSLSAVIGQDSPHQHSRGSDKREEEKTERGHLTRTRAEGGEGSSERKIGGSKNQRPYFTFVEKNKEDQIVEPKETEYAPTKESPRLDSSTAKESKGPETLPWLSEIKTKKRDTHTQPLSSELADIQVLSTRDDGPSPRILSQGSGNPEIDVRSWNKGEDSHDPIKTLTQSKKTTIQPVYKSVTSHQEKDGKIIESEVVVFKVEETMTAKAEPDSRKVTPKKKCESVAAKEATMMVRLAARRPGAKVQSKEIVVDSF